jgi:hypothetical protein
VGIIPYKSPGDVFQGIACFGKIKPGELFGHTVGGLRGKDSAFLVEILEITQRKPGR